MKKILLGALAMASLFMAACSGNAGDPKAVAKKFFEALSTMNVDEASKYATPESKQMLDLVKMGMSFAPANQDSLKREFNKKNINFSDPVINGDEATVSVTVDGKDKTDFKLKKVDGQWKVAFDKNTMMKTGVEKMKQEGADANSIQEAEKAMEMLKNPDSLKNTINQAGEALKDAGKAIDSLSSKIK